MRGCDARQHGSQQIQTGDACVCPCGALAQGMARHDAFINNLQGAALLKAC